MGRFPVLQRISLRRLAAEEWKDAPILRRFLPKGRSIRDYSDEQILLFADEINATPRKRLGYRTPEELFELQLDSIYATSWQRALFCSSVQFVIAIFGFKIVKYNKQFNNVSRLS